MGILVNMSGDTAKIRAKGWTDDRDERAGLGRGGVFNDGTTQEG